MGKTLFEKAVYLVITGIISMIFGYFGAVKLALSNTASKPYVDNKIGLVQIGYLRNDSLLNIKVVETNIALETYKVEQSKAYENLITTIRETKTDITSNTNARFEDMKTLILNIK